MHANLPWAYSMGMVVLVFGAVVTSLLVLLRLRSALEPDLFFKLVGLAIVISAGLSLIVVGYSQDQIASMMGLLGTVAGYILGQSRQPGPEQPKDGTKSAPP